MGKINNNEIEKFVDYVFSFYGKGGIYDYGFTVKDIKEAVEIYLNDERNIWGGGDSFDRENVRNIMLNKPRNWDIFEPGK